jgi:hypothetical protein
LLFDLERLSSNAALSGIIVVPAKTPVGYEVVTYTPPDGFEESVSSIGEDLWECTTEHYGLHGVVALLGRGGLPIKKKSLGHQVSLGAGEYTNRISSYGVKHYPRLLLPNPMGRFAKKIFGTARVFGVIGRASGVGAIALGVIDAAIIGKCLYDARHGN